MSELENRAPVPGVIVRTRTEWTVANSTNSSFRVMDALGGMKVGKIEIAKVSIAKTEGYDVVKWMVDFSSGRTEEFASRELLISRFNAVDISDPHPDSQYVDYKIDISSEANGVTRLWLHKELKDGTVDPDAPWEKQVTKVFQKLSTAGLVTVNVMPDETEGAVTLSGGALANYVPFWGHTSMVDWVANDWTRVLHKTLSKGTQASERAILAAELHKLLKEYPDA